MSSLPSHCFLLPCGVTTASPCFLPPSVTLVFPLSSTHLCAHRPCRGSGQGSILPFPWVLMGPAHPPSVPPWSHLCLDTICCQYILQHDRWDGEEGGEMREMRWCGMGNQGGGGGVTDGTKNEWKLDKSSWDISCSQTGTELLRRSSENANDQISCWGDYPEVLQPAPE